MFQPRDSIHCKQVAKGRRRLIGKASGGLVHVLMGFLMLFHSGGVAAARPDSAPLLEPATTLWTAGSTGVAAFDPAKGQRLELPQTAGSRALAVDAERRTLWVVTDVALACFTTDGRLLWRQRLSAVDGGSVALQIVPSDGSAWLARGDRLESFGAGGQLLQGLELGASARGLALDSDRSLLWVATANGLTARDAIAGYPVRASDLDGKAHSIAVTEDRIWLATGDRVVGLDAQGTRMLDREAAAVAAVGDGHGGLWLIGKTRLVLLDPQGKEVLTRRPFGAEREIGAWEFDPATRSLWLTDGRELVNLSASGWELGRQRLATGEDAVQITDLAVLSAQDIEQPSVEIVAPASGTRFDVRFRDERSGVRAGSLQATAAGSPLPVRCSYRADGARCQLESPATLGLVQLEVTVVDEAGNVSAPAVAVFDGAKEGSGNGESSATKVEAALPDNTKNLIPSEAPTYTPVVTPRGFRPNVPFLSASDIDHVDTASGNLVVTVPLGQTYQVGPILEYQLRPVYNSNLWQHIEVGCPATGCAPPHEPLTFASTNYAANAGLGWELHFGRLYAPIAPSGLPGFEWKRWPNRPTDATDLNKRWMYVSPSGAVTYLHSLPDRDNGTTSLPVRYSKDGSFLRMRQVSANEVQVHMPNGLISVFHKTGEKAGTEFCGDGITGCWRFHETRDPYGNHVQVTYSLTGSTEKWQVEDSTDRQHTITLSHADSDTGGGDGPLEYSTPEGDEWGDLRKVVTKVELAAFGSQKATYNFSYTLRTLQRGAPHDGHRLPAAVNTIHVAVLDKITVPLSQPWRFKIYDQNPFIAGRLSEVTGPTRGRIGWAYSSAHWFVPTRCTYHNVDPGSIEWDYAYTGVRTRTAKPPSGNETEGTWTYGSQLYPPPSQLPLSGPNCARANYRKTTVNGPADEDGKHTRTVYYNSVTQGPRLPNSGMPINQWQVTDGGLPFTKDYTIGDANSDLRFLSSQIFHCSSSGCGSAKRSTYVRYASEFRNQCNKSLGDSPGCYQSNPLPVAERTIFHDDGGNYIESEHQDYNGGGQFRRTVTQDNFGSGINTRVDTTDFIATGSTTLDINGNTGYVDIEDPASYLPSLTDPWILHPYSKQTAEEGGQKYVAEFQFNDQGSLICSRRWKGGSLRGGKDLVVKLQIGDTDGVDNGLPIRETVAGGEGGTLASPLCSINGIASQGTKFVLEHRYQHLQLSETYVAGFPHRYRATIDLNTGLPSETFNVSDQGTAYLFDELGRLKESTPENSLKQAKTEITYDNPAGSNPSVETVRKSNEGVVLTREKEVFDHFARPIRSIMRRPVGESSFSETEQRTAYNDLGWVTKVTTRQDKSDLDDSLVTTYEKYDAFGRPGRIGRPDGFLETRSYQGVRVSASMVEIRTSSDSNAWVETTTTRDSRGRVIKVENPLFSTSWTYDPYDVVVSARRLGEGIDQKRLYSYDARGLLLAERHPEIGQNGNGWVTYKPDAFGNRRRLKDDRRDLTYVYDDAGRPVLLKNTYGGKHWREWAWGSANSGSNYRKGKVFREIRHNYPNNDANDWAVYEEYEFRGKLGQVSKKTTQLQFPNNVEAERYGVFFVQYFGYDQLGNRTSYSYPKCAAAPQNGRRLCNDGPNDVLAPNHTVTVKYNQGLEHKVSSDLGPWAEYSYHHNLQMSWIDYSNNVDGIFDQGTNGMVRPQRLRYLMGSAPRFDTGNFGYDGAGNVWKIGADRYVYDQASRLRSGTVAQAGSGFKKEYRYDAADNILKYSQDGNPWVEHQVSAATNRMLNGQGHPITYDQSGNMTDVGAPALYAMEYDALNQQIRFENTVPGQQSVHLYGFGPGERRLIILDPSTSERTFKIRDLEGRVMREYEVTGWGDYVSPSAPGAGWVFQKDFIYGPSGLIATRSQDGTEHFFHQDHLGSTRAITNSSGARIGVRNFYPFGVGLANNSGADEPTGKFTGHERDPHNLTDYMLARTYLFPFGRFASVDPGRDGWNLYAYVGNNPIGRVDPDGQFAVGVAKKLLKLALKGGNVASAFSGAIADFNTVTDSDASLRDRVGAGISLASEIASPVSVRDAKAGIAGGRKITQTVVGAGRRATENTIELASSARSSFAKKQAKRLSQDAARDVKNLVKRLSQGNTNPGKGTSALGSGFFELRGNNAGRVIVKQVGPNAFDIVGTFQGHKGGDAKNSRIIQRFINDYKNNR
ncbi:MAG: RHS repeat-associated core domain-containing protein [Acidobacteriota bacterium]